MLRLLKRPRPLPAEQPPPLLTVLLFSPRRKETVGLDYHHGVFRVLVNPVLGDNQRFFLLRKPAIEEGRELALDLSVGGKMGDGT